MAKDRWSKPMGVTDNNYWLLRRWVSDAYALGYRDGWRGTPHDMGCPDPEGDSHYDPSAHKGLLWRAERIGTRLRI